MFYYNPKDWLLAIIKISKTDTIRTLAVSLIFISFYSWGIMYLELYYLMLSETSYAKDLTIMHSLLGFAISMLLVFRTNTAYDRWWEGRKHWGSLVNNSRKKFIFIYVITLPFGLALSVGYFTIPVTAFIFYVLASLELIAEEIEDPFGTDSNDLPMEKMAENIKMNVNDILK